MIMKGDGGGVGAGSGGRGGVSRRRRRAQEGRGTAQQEGAEAPDLRFCRAVTASCRVLTLTRRSPAGTAPLASAQLAAGVRKTVAPALRAPIIFCWMPP